LEDRLVPSTLSVTDVTVREGPTSLGVLDPAGAAALGLSGARDIVFNNMPGHPHYHDLFVTNYRSASVVRFDWASQTYQAFVLPGSGGIDQDLRGLAFGPDGNLYVTDGDQSCVLKFDGTTGSFLSIYVAAGSGGLGNAKGATFGLDGNLYVSSDTDQVLKYQGPSIGPNGEQPGQFLGVVANTGVGSSPSELGFGPDGNLYVACVYNVPYSGVINRYQGPFGVSPGQLIDTYVPVGRGGAKNPRSPVFDSQGHLYVTDGVPNEVLRYQGPNEANPGAFIDTYITSGQSVPGPAVGLDIGPDGNLYVGSRDSGPPTRFAPSSQASFAVTLDSASANPVSVNYATANGTAVAGTDYVQTSGTLVFPPGVTSQTVIVPITTVATAGSTRTFTMNLSSPVNATISRSQGTGSILNRITKFFVVDGSTPKTYQYGSGGTSEEISLQLSNDTAPRGVATTAAGTTVWVADANKNVYVYTNHGVLLGSWTAGGLNPTAQLEGIASNGTDIWLLDNKQDKVFKYKGAASGLSGSQNAASSFNLNSGNSNAKGIVTDGTSLWVVDDGSTTDKVFKYTLSGSLLGSWTIDAANSHPTGLTLNPISPSDIWVVDSGTKRVYQYTSAVSLTSGSQPAAATFALAAGNTNPQDIADPPSPGTRIIPALLPDPEVADGWTAQTLRSGMRPVLDRVATSAGARPSLASWLLDGIAQTTPLVPLGSRNAGQPVIHSTVPPFASETRSANRSATATPDPRPIKAGASNLEYWAVDQVFADPALELTNGDPLHRPVASV
jgi:hypothetical protein